MSDDMLDSVLRDQTIAQLMPEVDKFTGIRVIAVMLAMKYYDMTVIKEADMYRQIKAEGANIGTINMSDVLNVANQIEQHLFTEPKWLLDAAAKVKETTGVDPLPEIDPTEAPSAGRSKPDAI